MSRLICVVIILMASIEVYAATDLYCSTVGECLSMLPPLNEGAHLKIHEKQQIEEIFSKAIKIEKNNPRIYQRRAEYYFKTNQKDKFESDFSLALSLYKAEESRLKKLLEEAQDPQIKAIIYSKLSCLYEGHGDTYYIIHNLKSLQIALIYFELTVNSYEHILYICKEESTEICNLSKKSLPELIASREKLNGLVREMIYYVKSDMEIGSKK